MGRYEVTLLIEFVGEIEAGSLEEAEDLAIYDKTCHYSGVYSIETATLEEDDDEEEEEDEEEDE